MAYVYAHQRKDNGKCFYIGKGTGKRMYNSRERNEHWNNVVKKAGGFNAVVLVNNIPDELAYELEQSFIEQIGIENLCNKTEGGLGIKSGFKHKPRTKEHRNNISKALKGKSRPSRSEETKAKISKTSKGRPGYNRNKGAIYKELTTGYVGGTADMQEKFVGIDDTVIASSAKRNKPLLWGKFKGLHFKKLTTNKR